MIKVTLPEASYGKIKCNENSLLGVVNFNKNILSKLIDVDQKDFLP